ncbi:DUF7402 domain-containing protein [Hyalangium gracile]|uniref:DUF7402 domain-containing protein n=1 Tax=Hyalangium gracile TaxID=394092 RepID=UPI001CCEBEAC|nr:discoidin domain-containing protein [Hyalangium gracile]
MPSSPPRAPGLSILLVLLALCAAWPLQAEAQTPVGPVSCPLLPTGNNIAPEAEITVSSVYTDGNGVAHHGCKAVDGIIGLEGTGQWASDGYSLPWIKLEWATARTIDSIDLYDLVNTWGNIIEGQLTFSDGSTISVTNIPADGALKAIIFDAKTVTWVTFSATVIGGGFNGLSEIAIGEVRPTTPSYPYSEKVNLVFWPGTRMTTSTPYNVGAHQLDTKFGANEHNYWSFPDAAWIQLDLGVGNEQRVHQVRLRSRNRNLRAGGYKIWVGDDPTNAVNTLVADVTNNTRAIATETFPEVRGRFVRVQVFAPPGDVAAWLDGLSVYSTDAKPLTRHYPISEEGSGGARLEPLAGWGWYHSRRAPGNLLSEDPVATTPEPDRDDSNTELDLDYEGAAFRIQLSGTYALERLRLGYSREGYTPSALKVELSVDDLHYHTVFNGSLPSTDYAPSLTWSTANGNGDARYVRVTLPQAASPGHIKVLTRLELFGVPVSSPTIIPDELPPNHTQVGTIDDSLGGYLSAAIYDDVGRLVRTLKNREPVAAGNGRPLYWDGKDDYGNPQPKGPYKWKAVVSRASSYDDGSVGNTGNPSHGLTNAPHLALGLAYDPSGHLYSVSSWSEPEMELRRYKPDATPLWGVPAKLSTAVAADSDFAYVAQWKQVSNDMANVIRRYRASDGLLMGFTGVTDGEIAINPAAPNPKPGTRRRATTEEDRWFAGVNGVSVDATRVWVSNYRENRVESYDKVTGTFIGSFAVVQPLGIAADASGDVWVAHLGSRVTKYRAGLPTDADWGTPLQAIHFLSDPYAISLGVGGTRLLLTEHGTGRVREYDAITGAWVLDRGGQATPGPMQADRFRLSSRSGLAVDAVGQYVVADIGNHRLQWFNANGTLRLSMSSEFISAPFVDDALGTPNVVLSGPRQYTRNPVTGTWRYSHNWTPTDNAFVDPASKRRRLEIQTPQGPIQRDFLFYTADGWRGGVSVYLLEPGDTGMRRAAAIGPGWTGPDDNTLPGQGCFEWADSSGDGVVDTATEVTFRSFPSQCVAANYHVWVAENGDLWLAGTAPEEGAVVIPVSGFDAHYNPIYRFADRYTVLPADTSATGYAEALIRSIPGGTSFLTLGSTAESRAQGLHGGITNNYVATLHQGDGSERVRVRLHEEWGAFSAAVDGEYWYIGNSRGDQHWVNMYDDDGLLIATMRPEEPSGWGAGWIDHASGMAAMKGPYQGMHTVYAEDVYWGRMIRYVTQINPGDLSRSGDTFTW